MLLSLLLPALLTGPATAMAEEAPKWEQADEPITCADTEGDTPFYHGPSASTDYDATFELGHSIPQAMLDGYVPQGLGTWKNWGGPGEDLLLQAAYNDDTDRAVLVGLVPGGGETNLVTLYGPDNQPVNAHVGGVAVVGSWLYVTGAEVGGLPTVLRFSLPTAAAKLANGGKLKAVGQQRINVGTDGFNASFLARDRQGLWIGTFDEYHRNRMYRFTVGPEGGLVRVGGPDDWVQVPLKAQGLAVTKDHFLFSTSYESHKRSNVYVIRRGKKFLDAAYPEDLECFAAPSMSQGITLSRGKAFLSFESGSFRYRTDPCDKPIFFDRDCTRNVVTHLHRAKRATLIGMT